MAVKFSRRTVLSLWVATLFCLLLVSSPAFPQSDDGTPMKQPDIFFDSPLQTHDGDRGQGAHHGSQGGPSPSKASAPPTAAPPTAAPPTPAPTSAPTAAPPLLSPPPPPPPALSTPPLIWTVFSPNTFSTSVTFQIDKSTGCLTYSIKSGGDPLLGPSKFGFSSSPDGQLLPDLCDLEVIDVKRQSFDETWKPVFGQRSSVRNHYEEARLTLRKKGTQDDVGCLRIDVRVFDEGVGYRIVLLNPLKSPLLSMNQAKGDTMLLFGTRLNLDVGGSGTLYMDECCERGFKVYDLDEKVKKGWIYELPMHPFTVKYENGLHFAFTEARNLEFEAVHFANEGGNFRQIKATFRRNDTLPDRELITPWFAIITGRSPGELIERANDLVYNLNDPCAIQDPSWIRVGKVLRDIRLSTENSFGAIDIAPTAGLQHVLLDAGWYGPESDPKSDPRFWLKQPKKDPLDLMKVLEYAKSKGVGVFLYVNDIALQQWFDEIAPLYAKWGVAGIKFGFVEVMSSKDTARLIRYIKKCAEYKLLVNIHDYFRPTGFSRTYPNLVSIEGIRGDEHRETPTHGMMLPFVRYLGGFGDNTFVFDEERMVKMGKSLTHQIALGIIYCNPLQHLYWYQPFSVVKSLFVPLEPEKKHLEVWRDMPTTWEETKVLTSSIGQYIVMARRAATPEGRWFVAAATKDPVTLTIPFDFLDDSVTYTMDLYQDRLETLHTGGVHSRSTADATSSFTADITQGGGWVAVLTPKESLSEVDLTTPSKLEAVEFLEGQALSDSRLYGFPSDPRKYRVCTMFNACVDADRIYFEVADDTQRDFLNSQAQLCQENAPNKPEFCRCFARSLVPTFVKSLGTLKGSRSLVGHTWISDHWVHSSQIGHWIGKLVQFHSIFLEPESYGFPKVDRIAYVKTPPMNDLEGFFYKLATANLGYSIPEEPLFKLQNPICMSRASTSGHPVTMATSSEDMLAFRKTTNRIEKTNLQTSTDGRFCPSGRTVFLRRTEPANRLRTILNQEELLGLLSSKLGLVDVTVATTNSTITAAEQIEVFGDFGLMISSHSSQLVFSIFSQTKASIIEVAPTYFNSDFADLAQAAGLHYQFAFGGRVPSVPSSPHEKCNEAFEECAGDPECVKSSTVCTKYEVADIKSVDFEADIEEVLAIVSQAIQHLNEACGGRWPGAR